MFWPHRPAPFVSIEKHTRLVLRLGWTALNESLSESHETKVCPRASVQKLTQTLSKWLFSLKILFLFLSPFHSFLLVLAVVLSAPCPCHSSPPTPSSAEWDAVGIESRWRGRHTFMKRSLLSTFVLLRKHSPAPPTNDVNDGVSGAGIPLKNRCERSVSFEY